MYLQTDCLSFEFLFLLQKGWNISVEYHWYFGHCLYYLYSEKEKYTPALSTTIRSLDDDVVRRQCLKHCYRLGIFVLQGTGGQINCSLKQNDLVDSVRIACVGGWHHGSALFTADLLLYRSSKGHEYRCNHLVRTTEILAPAFYD